MEAGLIESSRTLVWTIGHLASTKLLLAWVLANSRVAGLQNAAKFINVMPDFAALDKYYRIGTDM
eukprot:6380444-Amphidinium_carterae.2